MDDVNSSQSSSQPHHANTPSTTKPVQAAGDPALPPILTPEELAALLLGKIDEFKAMVPNFQHHKKKRRADPTPCPADRRRYRRDIRMQLRVVEKVLSR